MERVIKPVAVALMLIAALKPGSSSASHASECEKQASEFAILNRPLIVENAEDARRLTATVEDAATEKIHSYVDEQILGQLSSHDSADSASLVLQIRCIQSLVPEYQRMAEVTNAPLAFSLASDRPVVALAYEIYRGGAGVPDLLPYFEIFERQKNEWKRTGGAGSEFASSTFFVQPLNSPVKGERWFLLYGNRIGETGSRLRLQVVAYDGGALRTVWEKADIQRAYVRKVDGDRLLVAGSANDPEGHEMEFTEEYLVVSEGLKLTERKIQHPRSN